MVVEAVRFGFMTDREVRRNSVVKITKPDLVDTLDKPIPGGLYDPALGALDENSPCKSCGQRTFCPGHYGNIDLVYPAYNPLLFNMLSNLLNITCLSCFHFRSGQRQVERCIAQLEKIKKGDIVGAKRMKLNSGNKKIKSLTLSDDEFEPEDSQGSHSSHSVVLSDGENQIESSRHAYWDSTHLSEAMNILNEFLKKKVKKCENCKFKNPKISKPTFGWFHVKALPGAHIQTAAIRGSILEVTDSGEDKPSSEVVNASDHSWKEDSGAAEASSSVAAANGSKQQLKKKSKLRKLKQDLMTSNNFFSGHLLPSEVRDIMKRLWVNEDDLCSYIVDIQQQQCNLLGKKKGYSMLFLQTIVVPPIKFRPPAKGGDSKFWRIASPGYRIDVFRLFCGSLVMEHPHTLLLGKVLQSNIALGQSHQNNSERSKIISRWMDLQQSINVLFDSKTATSQAQKDALSGICQRLEKKEGIFRQKMMGKRVNFACRSVISPDPYLAVNEIGIPPYFAKWLTYPMRVTPWNAEKSRNAVINGPEIHPGSTTYVDSVATIRLPLNQKKRQFLSRKLPSSRGVATQTGKNSQDFEGKIVNRHLQDGDIVLLNRQPTLHKPSIMAHVVRVLKGEKTLRMHYANCSSYNADFDGDEMNVHFPQDEISRAEAYNIVNANEQYIVPTRGDTVRGLIQDHIIAATYLSLKETFLTRDEFSQLLYGSGVFASRPGSVPCNISRKVSSLDSEAVESVLPTIWKPRPLWTGKQVITALLNHITRGCAPCTIKNQAKLPKTYFTSDNSKHKDEDEDQNAETNFFVWKNEVVRGVIDKAQFGKFGLVHSVQELYGSESAGILLSALSRLFTTFLQIHGFTCGLDDLMILPHYDEQRKEKLEGEDVGLEVHCDFVKFEPGQIGPEELQLEIEKAICRDRESATAFLDMKMKNKLTTKLTREGSQVLKHLLTKGLLKPFPKNCISVMTTTGAKGSTVNFQQISAYLGQQELEGKRVPRMVSGKTLPCFPPWDYTSRAGGFITDRFLSGLRPQEYYFHCMAGREGLVDTAVKTSRSGYLQRCLIKNLESLKVCYDYTVRDADGSVIQFYYGEDGVDVHKTSFLKNFKALEDNQETIWQKFQNKREFNNYVTKLPEGLEEEATHYIEEVQVKTSETHSSNATENLHGNRKRRKELRQDKDKAIAKEKNRFIKLLKQKYLSSLAEAGEPVGVIAAQSVGEPSTQMTLNTFHLAGRGEMNVTLGIPRLQEILMTASEVIKTPILTCPFSKWRSRSDAVSLISSVRKATIADMVESMDVQVSFQRKPVSRVYKLTMHIKDTEFVSLEDTWETLKTTFLKELEDALEHHVIFLSKIGGIKNLLSSSRSESSIEAVDVESGDRREEVQEDEDDDDSDQGDDLGSDAQKRKQQSNDEMDYEDASDLDHGEDVLSADEKRKSTVDDLDDADSQGEETEHFDDVDEASNVQNVDEVKSEAKSSGKNSIAASEKIDLSSVNASDKKKRRAFYMELKGLSFEIHFRFTSEPDLLLAQIAQRTAKKVYVKRSGKISQCKLVQYDPDEKTIIWDDKKKPKGSCVEEHDGGYWAVKASGVDFKSIWEMQDDLDLNRLYSNNIHAMLMTYGVEAARATIIREIKQVFDIYGVKVDYRHLSLIADYMTHTGGYRPMSRHGISDSISPFLKMSFETASKFIVEAATHGLTDNLETPSSRICLGLPVKMGTGSFDLMQRVM